MSPSSLLSPLARLAAATLLLTGAAAAQTVPADIATKLKAMGPVIDPPKVGAIYAPLQQKEPFPDIRIERDVAYGPAERNRLDVFMPEASLPSPRPVLIFVHGGGFVAGDKHTPGSPFYDNIAAWAANNGFIGVNITYRLAPQAPWPAGAEDVGAAVRWVGENIGARGGDPARVYLMGHSAGAVHVASYASHPEFHGPKGVGLAGAILVSGLYDLTAIPFSKFELAYFGDDAATYAQRSSLAGLLASKLPLLVMMAELDPLPFAQQYKLLTERLCNSQRGCVRTAVLAEHSHISEVYAINTPDTGLTSQILAFTAAGK
ncbi:MAG: alpha/beta hydrolase [Pseudomonadota bacterium]